MNLRHRSYEKEILDHDNIPFEDIRRNMQELNFINTWLGGHNITVRGLKKLIGKSKEVLVCEIGCGGGDNLYALNRWCSSKGIKPKFIGIDIKKECIAYAKSKRNNLDVDWIINDYQKVSFNNKPGIIFSSLFCHHFSEIQLVEQLRWMYQNSTVGFFINDLQRHPLAYYSIKYLTSLFSSSYLVKNDAPLSVARGFHKKEWNDILAKAGITDFKISWQWAFRYLIVYKHE